MRSNHFKQLFFQFLLTYLVVITLPVITWAVVSYSYRSQMSAREVENNRAQIDRLQMVIDQQFSTIDQLSMMLANSLVINRALQVEPPLAPSQHAVYKDAVEALFDANLACSGIEHLYIYLNKSGTILYHSGMYSKETFYKAYLSGSDFGYEQWLTDVLSAPEDCLFARRINGQVKMIRVVSVPLLQAGNPAGKLVIQLDTERIERMLPALQGGFSAIVSDEKELLYTVGNMEVWEGIRDSFTIENTGFERIIGGERMRMEVRPSQSRYIGYVSVIPVAALEQNVNSMLVSLVTTFAASLALALITSVLFSLYMTRPLVRAAGALDLTGTGKGRMLERLSEAVLSIASDNQEIARQLEVQRPMARNDLLMRLMRGEPGIREDLRRHQEAFGINFRYEYFCCVRVEAVCPGDEGSEMILQGMLASGLIQRELSAYGDVEAALQSYNIMLLLINSKDGSVSCESLIEACDRVRKRVTGSGQFRLHISVGTWHRGIPGIAKTYNEAVDAEHLRFIAGSEAICSYIPHGADAPCRLPGSWRRQLSGAVLSNDMADANGMIETIVAENGGCVAPSAMKRLLLDICSAVLNGMQGDSDAPWQEKIMQVMDCIIVGSIQADEASARIYAILHELGDARVQSKSTSRDALKEKILRCIEENYASADASVASIAQLVGVNPSYLSHSARELIGETVMDMVNRRRIEQAKILLAQTDLTQQAIAQRVGYVNETVFIRNFKRCEGITPGRYREFLALSLQAQ